MANRIAECQRWAYVAVNHARPGHSTLFGPGSETRIEHLSGLIERVTFHNAENGFCVLRVQVRGQRDLVTVVGHAALVSAGEAIQASGTWINDRTHGLQFRAAACRSFDQRESSTVPSSSGSREEAQADLGLCPRCRGFEQDPNSDGLPCDALTGFVVTEYGED